VSADTLSFTRLKDMIELTPGNLITHLRKPEDAGYVSSEKTGKGGCVANVGHANPPRSRGAGRIHTHAARPSQWAIGGFG
jgi:hypothetical protein